MMNNQAASQILDQAQAVSTPQTSQGLGTTQEQTPQSSEPQRNDPKLNIYIQREREILARERALKEQESQFKEFQEYKKKFDEAKGKNSKAALELLGMDYNQLTESLLNDGKPPPEVEINKVREEFTQYKSEQEVKEKEREEQLKKSAEEREQQAVGNFKKDISQYLSDNKNRYELIDFEGQQELVFSVIDEHYTRTTNPETGVGKVMSIQEAADKVEEFLEKKEIDRKKLSKVQTLWNAVPKVFQEKAAKQVENQVRKPSTLTNQLSATQQTPRTRPMTDEERVQRAVAYAREKGYAR